MEDKDSPRPTSRSSKLSKLPKLLSSSNKKSPNSTTFPVTSFSRGDAVEHDVAVAVVSTLPPTIAITSHSNSNVNSTGQVTVSKEVTIESESGKLPQSPMMISRKRSFLPKKVNDKNRMANSTAETVLTPLTPFKSKNSHVSSSTAAASPIHGGTTAQQDSISQSASPKKSFLPLPKKLTADHTSGSGTGTSHGTNGVTPTVIRTSTRPMRQIPKSNQFSRQNSHSNLNTNNSNSKLLTEGKSISKISNPNTTEHLKSKTSISHQPNNPKKISRLIPSSISNIEKENKSPQKENSEGKNQNKNNPVAPLLSPVLNKGKSKKSKLPKRELTITKPTSDKAISIQRTPSAQKCLQSPSSKSQKSFHANLLDTSINKTVGVSSTTNIKTNIDTKSNSNKRSETTFSYSQRFKKLEPETDHKEKTMRPKVSKHDIELKRESKTSSLLALPLQEVQQKKQEPSKSTTTTKRLHSDKNTSITESLVLEDATKAITGADIVSSKVKSTPSKESTFTVKNGKITNERSTGSSAKSKVNERSKGGVVGIYETSSPLLLDTSESDSEFRAKSTCKLELKKSHSLKEIWPKLEGKKSPAGKEGLTCIESPAFNESFSDFEFLELARNEFQRKPNSTDLIRKSDLPEHEQHLNKNLLTNQSIQISEIPNANTLNIPIIPADQQYICSKRHSEKNIPVKLKSSKVKAKVGHSPGLSMSINSELQDPSFVVSPSGHTTMASQEQKVAEVTESTHLIQFSSAESVNIKRDSCAIKEENEKTSLLNSLTTLDPDLAVDLGLDFIDNNGKMGETETLSKIVGAESVPTIRNKIVADLEAAMQDESNPQTISELDSKDIKEKFQFDNPQLLPTPHTLHKVSDVTLDFEVNNEEMSSQVTQTTHSLMNTKEPVALLKTEPKVVLEFDSIVSKDPTSKTAKHKNSRINSFILPSLKSDQDKCTSPKSLKRGIDIDTEIETEATRAKVTKSERLPKIVEGSMETKITSSVNPNNPHGTISISAIPIPTERKSNNHFDTDSNLKLSEVKNETNTNTSAHSISFERSSATTSSDSFKSAKNHEHDSTTSSSCSLSLRMLETMPLEMSSVSLKVAELLSQNSLQSQSQSQSQIPSPSGALTTTMTIPTQTSRISSFQSDAIVTTTASIPLKQCSSKDSKQIPVLIPKLKRSAVQSSISSTISLLEPRRRASNNASIISSEISEKSVSKFNLSSVDNVVKVNINDLNGNSVQHQKRSEDPSIPDTPTTPTQFLPEKPKNAIADNDNPDQGRIANPTAVSKTRVSKLDPLPQKSSCTFILKAPKSPRSDDKLESKESTYISCEKVVSVPVSVTEIPMIENNATSHKVPIPKFFEKNVALDIPIPTPKRSKRSALTVNGKPGKSIKVEEREMDGQLWNLQSRKEVTTVPFTPNNTPFNSNLNSSTMCKNPFVGINSETILRELESVGNLHSACLSCRLENINSIVATSAHSLPNSDSGSRPSHSSPFVFINCDQDQQQNKQETLLPRKSQTMGKAEALIEKMRAARRRSIQQFELKQQLAGNVIIDDSVSLYSVGSHLEGFLRIQNKSAMAVCYRVCPPNKLFVKITPLDAGRYQIIPFSGRLECMETVSITIASPHPSKYLKREANQFKVETALVSFDIITPSEQRLFWKEVPRREVCETFVDTLRISHPNNYHQNQGDSDSFISNDEDSIRMGVSSGDGITPSSKMQQSQVGKQGKKRTSTSRATIGLYTVVLGLLAAALHQCSFALGNF